MIIKINNSLTPVNEEYEFTEVSIDDKYKCSFLGDEKEKDMAQITRDVNNAVHGSDIFWESYKSVMTHVVLPLQLYRDYVKQYNDFIDAVKHYYYDDNFSNYFLFTNIINSLKTSRTNLENVLSEQLFEGVSYPIDKLIDYIKNTFLGDYMI